MPVNDFLPFALSGPPNVVTQAAWAALTARSNGFLTGLAESEQLNKAWRQPAFVSHVLADVMMDSVNADVLDDANIANFKAQLILTLAQRGQASRVASLNANTTLTPQQSGLYLFDASGGARTLTLPAANGLGAGLSIRISVARTDTSGNSLTLILNGANTLNGLVAGGGGGLTIPGASIVHLASDGVSAWRLIGSMGLYSAQVFTASGSAVAPWWARKARVRVDGAGGGGGGTTVANAAGAGGAGGGRARGRYDVTPGSTTAVTVGVGGTAGSNVGPTAGGTGGTSSFGALCSATGGGGGGFSTSGINVTIATVGVAIGANIEASTGGESWAGFPLAVGVHNAPGGPGGGGGGPMPHGGASNLATTGQIGYIPGGGGGGGINAASGGSGARGEVLVEWET